jgi:hypothetical protein
VGWHTRDTSLVDDALKGRAILAVPILDEILSGLQKSPGGHRECGWLTADEKARSNFLTIRARWARTGLLVANGTVST